MVIKNENDKGNLIKSNIDHSRLTEVRFSEIGIYYGNKYLIKDIKFDVLDEREIVEGKTILNGIK